MYKEVDYQNKSHFTSGELDPQHAAATAVSHCGFDALLSVGFWFHDF